MDEFRSFNGDDVPEEILKIVQGIAKMTMDTGLAHDPAEQAWPSKTQLELVPGDYVGITHSGSRHADIEFMIAQVANPEEHADQFPDWEQRMTGTLGSESAAGSFLLVKWVSPTNLDGSLGWVPRARMVKVPQERYEEMLGWFHDGPPEDMPPRWMVLHYGDALAEMSEANPDTAAQLVQCPDCGSYGVTISYVQTNTQMMVMGTTPDDRGKTIREAGKLHEVSNYIRRSEGVTTLRCWACEYTEVLPDEIGLFE